MVLWIRDLPLGPPMVDATFPSDHGENSSCLVKSIEGAIVTASCTTGVIGGGGTGKRSAGLWGASSRFWLGSSDTSSPKLIIQVFSLVYPEEGSIAETSVKIPIITASVLQFLN